MKNGHGLNPKKKKTLLGAVALSCAAVICASVPLSVSAAVYRNYQNAGKTESGAQFSAASNYTKDEIVLDGRRDDAYDLTPVITYGGADGKSVSLYTKHTDNALYFLFNVKDSSLRTIAASDTDAWSDDCVELYLDPMLNGGERPQKDDIELNISLSGFMRQLRGTGSGWGSGTVSAQTAIHVEGTINHQEDGKDDDTGWSVEVRMSYFLLGAGVRRNSPIGIALAHGDLKSGKASRDWYGLSGRTDGLKVASTAVPDGYLVLTADDRLMGKEAYNATTITPATVQGIVRDSFGKPITGAKLSGTLNGQNIECTTENGIYRFYDVTAEHDLVLDVEAEGYYGIQLTIPKEKLLSSAGGEIERNVSLYSENSQRTTIYGKLIGVDGAIAGAQISVAGYPNLTAGSRADGSFEIELFNGGTFVVSVEKEGYEIRNFTATSDKPQVGDLEIYKTLTSLGTPASNEEGLNAASAKLGSCINGYLAKFTLERQLGQEESIELYTNTGDVGFNGHFNEGDRKFVITATGSSVYGYSDGWEKLNGGIAVETVDKGSDVEISAKIPLELIGVTGEQSFGASFRFYNGAQWQDTLASAGVEKKLDALSTIEYLRFAPNGTSYIGYDNTARGKNFLYYSGRSSTFDTAVTAAAPSEAERVYTTYQRTASGLKLNVLVEGTLGTFYNKTTSITGAEAINIVLDLDGWRGTSWNINKSGQTCYDINLRIYADAVCYVNSASMAGQSSNQLWWSDRAHNNGVAGNFTLTSQPVPTSVYEQTERNGYRLYSFEFTNAQLSQMSGGTVNSSTEVRYAVWEVNETSKTTIFMYSSAGEDNVRYENGSRSGACKSVASQAEYFVLAGGTL